MKKRKKDRIVHTAGCLLCAMAVLCGSMLSGIRQVAAVEEEPGYIEKEIAAGTSTNSEWDSPEIIPVNTLCEGTVGGPCADSSPDWGDTYQFELDPADFTGTKRGRFHIEMETMDNNAATVSFALASSTDMSKEYYSAEVSSKLVTPTYSMNDVFCISLLYRDDDSTKIRYRLKVVYDVLENNESGQWAETERNSLPDHAAQLQVNRNYWGCMQDQLASNSLWYKYTLDAPGTVSVTLSPQDGKRPNETNLWEMEVYTAPDDPEGDSERYSSGALAAGVQSADYKLGAGTYYISMTTWADTSVGQIYNLNVNYKPEGAAAATTTVAPGGTQAPSTSTETPGATQTPAGTKKAAGSVVTTTTTTEEGSTTVTNQIKKIVNTKVIQVTMKVSSKKSVALKWKKNKVAQGYKIYRSTKKKKGFRCVKTIKNKNTTKWKDTKVRKGKTYYYKLRAYKKIRKKTYYSKYTKTLKVKVK